MKKIFLGVLIGMMLMIPVQVFAQDVVDVIGKKVDGVFNFTLNDTKTNKTLIDVEGTSYISIRDVAELLGYDIFFDKTDNEVTLSSKSYTPPTQKNEIHWKTIEAP